MTTGIYCIENLVNGKKYVGQALNIDKRIKTHLRNFKKEDCPRGQNQPLWRAVRKYGIINFKIYTIRKCIPDKLDDLEEKFILKLKSLTSKNGYNICQRGKNRIGAKNTEEQNSKISFANSGEKHYNYGKRGEETPHFGFIHSEKTRALISKNARGKQIGKKEKGATSKYHGVYKKTHLTIKKGKKYKYIYWVFDTKHIRSKHKRLTGHFKNEIDAAKAHDDFILKNNLNHYPLNFK